MPRTPEPDPNSPATRGLKPLLECARIAGVHRNTIGRWLAETPPRLKTVEPYAPPGSRVLTTYLDPAEVKALAASITRGRPKPQPKAGRRRKS